MTGDFNELAVFKKGKRVTVIQSAAGELLGLDQPNVSALVNEKISRFSVEKLMTFVSRLGFGVSVRIEGAGLTLDMPVTSGALPGNWGNEVLDCTP